MLGTPTMIARTGPTAETRGTQLMPRPRCWAAWLAAWLAAKAAYGYTHPPRLPVE